MDNNIFGAVNETERYLGQIAERLNSGNASVMVGAGFSKNAKKNNPSQKDFPGWDELGDIFLKIVKCQESGNDQRYSNVPDLADQVQALTDRQKLYRLLNDSIPDNDYKPSELHVDLLELPWADIFTTNYDTLLERTNTNIGNRKYSLVNKEEELLHRKKPSIIKLHGSLPFGPFTITTEDYRKYPIDHCRVLQYKVYCEYVYYNTTKWANSRNSQDFSEQLD